MGVGGGAFIMFFGGRDEMWGDELGLGSLGPARIGVP